MKDVTEILRFIDGYVARSLDRCRDRPALFFGSPEALEEILIALEELRDFILSNDWPGTSSRSGYGAFLVDKKDVGTLDYTLMRRQRDGVTDNQQLYEELCDTWAEYLRSPYRRNS
ncbi:MAG: hypothetical protein WD875_04920 [Pirellulales bacterium]